MGVSIRIGIDLGTTNSCIAYHDGKRVQVLTLEGGNKTLPSCVMYDHGKVIVGRKAYENRYKTKQVIYSTKRDIGTDTVYHIDDGDSQFDVTPIEVSAEILKELKRQVENKFQSEFTGAVITVPAYFNDRQKRDTLQAGHLAGFKDVRLLAEPSAAALSYTKNVKNTERAVVYDLGGGTFDVSLIDIIPATQMAGGIFAQYTKGNSVATVQVIQIEGNNKLGGDDFDRAVYRDLCREVTKICREEHGVSKNFNFAKAVSAEQRERLILNIESSKKLYDGAGMMFMIPVTIKTGTEEFEVKYQLSGEIFKKCFMSIFEETIQRFDKVIQTSDRKPARIILIGGSTKFPILKQLIHEVYPDMDIYDAISPDYSVAIGAAIMAASDIANIAPINLFDVVPQNIGIGIEKITMGVQKSDVFKVVIPKNSQIPASYFTVVETEYPEQTEAMINIYEGDSIVASENAFLGNMVISDIKPGEKRTPIMVRLSVDINGLLELSATQNDIECKVKLVNVVKSNDRVKEDAADSLVSRKYSRYNKLLSRFTLTDDEKKILEEQERVFEVKHDFTTAYLEIIRKYQRISLDDTEAKRMSIVEEGEKGYTEMQDSLKIESGSAPFGIKR